MIVVMSLRLSDHKVLKAILSNQNTEEVYRRFNKKNNT